MDLAKSPPEIGKKIWSIVRIVLYMMRKSTSKTKITVDIHMLLKKWKTASKAIGNLILHHHHHYAALTCRSGDTKNSFISPREYEFSCSNTPVYLSKLRKNHHHYRDEEVKVMQKVFDILRRYDAVDQASSLPEFGSPVAQKLTVTDSPFPVKDAEESGHQVDKDAEEFIKKFYRDLKNQKRIAALKSPSPSHAWG